MKLLKPLLMVIALAFMTACQQQSNLLPYQNPKLSPEERAADLLSRLSLEQKASLMMNSSAAIPEFGIRKWDWWSEALHGAARSGYATVFPQSIGMAASWDPELVKEAFTIASNEQRIKFAQARAKDDVKRYSGLCVWTPNINIFRDPRWGRGQETYGEDPYLTRVMGYNVVNGLQGTDEGKVYAGAGKGKWHPYDKLHACLKHYAVHSGPESERHYFDATDISPRDLAETYLYAFENIVKTTDVHEVMCAYNAYEGDPCCGSDKLLTQILRNEWGYKGLVVSDCGAVGDFYVERYKNHQKFPGDAEASAANAVLSGTDIECGGTYRNLPGAVARGAIKEEDIDVSVMRLLIDRFRLGEMDDDKDVSWMQIPESSLASDESDAVALQMARETMTLLQNKNNVLPLNKKGLKIALVGPNAADSIVMWGNYYGKARHTSTVLEALQNSLKEGQSMSYHRASSIVSADCYESCFGDCVAANGQKGFSVKFWNGFTDANTQSGFYRMDREALQHRIDSLTALTPAAEGQMSSPWQLSTGGNTVFAPGVDLEGFLAVYETTYHANADQEIVLNGYCNGAGSFYVNGEEVKTFSQSHGGEATTANIQVKKGKDYQIKLVFRQFYGDAQMNFDLGVMKPVDLAQLVKDTEDADVYVYVGGISPLLEGEEMKVPYEGFMGGDRTNIQLPKIQRQTLEALHKTGKPVVFVNMSGSAMGLVPELETCDAILQAWYGGQQGGQAVVDVLLGDYNPAGRLPVTFYADVHDLPDFHDYNFKGHTYRYYEGKPVFAFGYGISYSSYSYGQASSKYENGEMTVTVPVTNTSAIDGEEVVQVYLKRDNDVDGPIKALRGFKRVKIAAGQTVNVEIPVGDLKTFDDNTVRMALVPGAHTIYVGSSSRAEDLQELKVTL